MNVERSKESIIWIALVYNYIANHERSLSFQEIAEFVRSMKQELTKMHSKWNIIETEDNDFLLSLSHYGIEKDDNNQKYTLLELHDFDWKYEYQPVEIIKASLEKSVLFTIFVDKSDLTVTKEYYKSHDNMEVCAQQEKQAIDTVWTQLEKQGCKNIKIAYAFITRCEGCEPVYLVSYSCEIPVEKVNVLVRK